MPGEDFLVLRAKHRMLRQSYIGGLYTGRYARDTDAGALHTAGADFLLAPSTFLGSQNLSIGGLAVHTANPLATGKSGAFGWLVDYPNDPWDASFLYREIQENYHAAVGFAPRTGFRRLAPAIQYTSRPRQHRFIRTIEYGVSSSFLLDTAGSGLLNRDVDATLINLGTHTQDSFQVHVLPAYERLERSFTISPRITLQSRFRWILRPGSDFYIVYTHNWLDDPLQNRLHTLDRRAASKVMYTHRF